MQPFFSVESLPMRARRRGVPVVVSVARSASAASRREFEESAAGVFFDEQPLGEAVAELVPWWSAAAPCALFAEEVIAKGVSLPLPEARTLCALSGGRTALRVVVVSEDHARPHE